MSLEYGNSDYDFQMFIEEVYTFNDIADSVRGSKRPTLDDLKNQFKIISEEVKETGDAIEDNDPAKMLDGVVDMLVTVLGMAQQLEELGYNVMSACQRVASDNLNKYVADEDEAKASVEALKNKGINARYAISDLTVKGDELFVILDDQNKVRKPLSFKSTDLSEYVPYENEGV